MTSMLSAISGQFSKSLILGVFFPVAVFVLLARVLVVPLLPAGLAIINSLLTLDPQWEVLALSLVSIVLSGLLYNLNIPIIRVYEGYPWQDSIVDKRRTEHYKTQLVASDARWQGLRTLLYALNRKKRNLQRSLEADPIEIGNIKGQITQLEIGNIKDQITQLEATLIGISDTWDAIARNLNSTVAWDQKLVLPTRLGNVIRSFEHYPIRQYSISAIAIWPRLISKIDEKYASVLDEAKTSFDFMLNCSVLSALLALLLMFIGLLYPSALVSQGILLPFWVWWLVEIMLFATLAYVFYLLLIGRARDWGNVVKGAFDLYRGELLKQLGYKQLPATRAEERALWSKISAQIIFGDPVGGQAPDYDVVSSPSASTFATSKPTKLVLEVLRGIALRQPDQGLTILLRVKHGEAPALKPQEITITDTPPPGFAYTWGSARCVSNCELIDVTGISPYHFTVRSILEANENLVLAYDVLPLKSGEKGGAAHVEPNNSEATHAS